MSSVQSFARIVAMGVAAIAVLAAGPSSAQTQTMPTSRSRIAPGQAVEFVPQAATVRSTRHYQAMLGLNCSFHTCSGSFPTVAAKRQINVTRISCTITSQNANSVFGTGEVDAYNSALTLQARQYMVNIQTSTAGTHTTNDAIDFLVTGGQHIYVSLLISNDNVSFGSCSISGTLDVLG